MSPADAPGEGLAGLRKKVSPAAGASVCAAPSAGDSVPMRWQVGLAESRLQVVGETLRATINELAEAQQGPPDAP